MWKGASGRLTYINVESYEWDGDYPDPWCKDYNCNKENPSAYPFLLEIHNGVTWSWHVVVLKVLETEVRIEGDDIYQGL